MTHISGAVIIVLIATMVLQCRWFPGHCHAVVRVFREVLVDSVFISVAYWLSIEKYFMRVFHENSCLTLTLESQLDSLYVQP